jgi:uracil phosphoribosyltransferase
MQEPFKQIRHHYPKQVHILDNPYLTTLVAQVSQNECQQPLFNFLVKDIFKELLINIINKEWPLKSVQLNTRMTDAHKDQKLLAQIFDAKQKAVCVDIARAGMLPSQIFFDNLNLFIQPKGLRIDHIFASRATNEKGVVTHTDLNSLKIGGDIDDCIVLLPDPMGATGNSLSEVIDYYKKNVPGRAKRFISAHMIITPEFIQKLTTDHPEVVIYSARLDRGLSTLEALKKEPGELWDQEKGLNDSQYIVPGAGGVGELINNSFV